MAQCVICDSQVQTLSDTPICSTECKEDWVKNRVSEGDTECPICGIETHKTTKLLYHINQSEGMHDRYELDPVEVVSDTSSCEFCGEKFVIRPGNANRFCCKECEGLASRSDAHSVRQSGMYQEWRDKQLDQANGCANCSKRENLHVHHIEKVAENPERIVDDDNAIVLCASCHAEAHKGDRVYGMLKQHVEA